MNKSARRIACLLLSLATALPLVACGGNKDNSSSSSSGGTVATTYDRETRPVVFATELPDGNFNPFFATSGVDSEMLGMTQLGMLTTDKDGQIVYGEDEPTVTLDYRSTTLTENGKNYTDYEFIIKNGIKFSDGVDLTIKDVLFNLYVYLDPMYMGSATMYSTKIVGLEQYRTQTPDLGEDQDGGELDKIFEASAEARLDALMNYLMPSVDVTLSDSQKTQAEADKAIVKKEYKELLESFWTSCYGTVEDQKKEGYNFSEDWEVYYLAMGIIDRIREENSTKYLKYMPDPADTSKAYYVTNLTPAGVILVASESGTGDNKVYTPGDTYEAGINGGNYYDHLIEEIDAAKADETAIKKYTDDGIDRENAIEYVVRDHAINVAYEAGTASDYALGQSCFSVYYDLYNHFKNEAKSEYYAGKKMNPETISGITTSTTTKDFSGKEIGEHDVLKIRIHDIDPKAVYNFSFAVAPMHYYSGTLDGVDYVKKAMDDDGGATGIVTNFGVAFMNQEFFEEVLQNTDKNKKPVGAGAYQVSNQKGNVGDSVKGTEFFSNNWVYFARNDHFHTVGEGIENAKIKYVRYKVVNTDAIIQSLQSKEIDVGEPNATSNNTTTLSTINHVSSITVPTNGYGYVGVNPRYIPDVEVRRAIMMAMDLSDCLAYYTTANASILYRSMSKESWVWDYLKKEDYASEELIAQNGPDPYAAYYKMETNKDTIHAMLRKAGWTYNGSKWSKGNEPLKFTFTIAGSTTDHPAYNMFMHAAQLLNSWGFEITVSTDVTALNKLAKGELAVWAAAWSSTIDPDMYQVYHKDSTATSTLNWGYGEIKKDPTGDKYSDEWEIIEELSVIIEDARKTDVQNERAQMYKQALDLVMEMAVELPTYQRNDCVAWNKDVINEASLNDDPSAYAGVIDKIWELDYN